MITIWSGKILRVGDEEVNISGLMKVYNKGSGHADTRDVKLVGGRKMPGPADTMDYLPSPGSLLPWEKSNPVSCLNTNILVFFFLEGNSSPN